MLLPSDLALPAKFISYHPGQEDTILALSSSPSRFKLLSAPTGAGKSPIYYSLARLDSARTLILVSTKTLQQQLIRDFEPAGLFSLVGHGNYRCAERVYDDDGSLLDMECTAGASCQHRRDIEISLGRSEVVTNYANWVHMALSGDPDRLGKFDLIVLDEAHLVDNLLTDLLSVTLVKSTIRNLLDMDLPTSIDIPSLTAWSRVAVKAARSIAATLRDTNGDPREIAKIGKLERNLSRISIIGDAHWVVERQPRGLKLSPVRCGDYTEQYLFRGVESIVLCSATLSRSVASILGIKSSDFSYLEVGSRFDHKRCPFIYIPTTRVDYKMWDGQTRQLINRIDEIIRPRAELGWKGIIHTRSYKRAEEVMARSKCSGVMITHDSGNARDVIDRFKRSRGPLVLVSPSVEEGHDFPYDECRFQIILKVPFLDTRSPIMKARIEIDKRYPDYATSLALVQMAGRGMRAPDDWCECMILDDHFGWFKNRGDFPRWFKRTWVRCDEVPEPLQVAT